MYSSNSYVGGMCTVTISKGWWEVRDELFRLRGTSSPTPKKSHLNTAPPITKHIRTHRVIALVRHPHHCRPPPLSPRFMPSPTACSRRLPPPLSFIIMSSDNNDVLPLPLPPPPTRQTDAVKEIMAKVVRRSPPFCMLNKILFLLFFVTSLLIICVICCSSRGLSRVRMRAKVQLRRKNMQRIAAWT